MNPKLNMKMKMKLEAIEDDDKLLLAKANAQYDEDDDDSSEVSSDESGSESEEESGSEYEQVDREGAGAQDEDREDVKPLVMVKLEGECDEEFERLVERIRSSDGTASLAQGWDFMINDTEEYRRDLRKASGIGCKGMNGRHASGALLSFHTKALIGTGNQAYVDGDRAAALRTMLEVLRIEPRAAAAWTVLAQCYEDEGREAPAGSAERRAGEGKALQLRIMGAHVKQDAEEWDRLARVSRELGYRQQALYCWAKAGNIDPTNVQAQWDRAVLARELGDFNTTRIALLAILARFPHDLAILGELRPLLIDAGDLHTCVSLFAGAFEHFRGAFPSGEPGAGKTEGEGEEGDVNETPRCFGLLEVLVLADLYNALEEHERAVEVVRRGCRWLQGRAAQAYWDLCSDDREWDVRGGVVREPEDGGREDEDEDENGEEADVDEMGDGDVEPGYHELDVNARHRLAIARIKMGEVGEGKIHADIVLAEDILDYAPLFTEIADAYFERELFAEARAVYELLGGNPATSGVYILLQTAACLREADELQDAVEVYEAVRKADPTNNEAKMKLAEVYEILNQPRKALELVYEVIDSRKRGPNRVQVAEGDIQPQPKRRSARGKLEKSDDADATALAAIIQDKPPAKPPVQRKSTRKPGLSNAELRAMEAQKEAEVLEGYRKLKTLWPHMLAGAGQQREEWLLEAEKLIETFRETRKLFSTARTFSGMFQKKTRGPKLEAQDEEERMMSRLQLDVAQDTTARRTRSGDKYNRVNIFRGVSFDDWLRIFIQYAFTLTQSGNYRKGDEVLRHILMSSAYQLPAFQISLRVALITCAAAVGHYPVVVEQVRKFLMSHQFHNDPVRIMLAVFGSGSRATDAFVASAFQKFLHRELRLSHAAANTPDAVMWSKMNKRFSLHCVDGGGDEAEEEGANDGGEEQKPARARGRGKNLPQLPDIARKNNPVAFALYGQICLATKSFQSAMFYLLMAYDYCQDDPLIALSIIVASLGRAVQRQCDNRHHLVTQAMAFLSRYRESRSVMGNHTIEIEYNFGRTFQHIGLYSHAARHYERALGEAAKCGPTDTLCARETAYNLSMIYSITGAPHLAVELYRRWLVV
ncbi:TPR-like protein [Mycena crocata]|nr:TPR-like protein [Mycena crocata]